MVARQTVFDQALLRRLSRWCCPVVSLRAPLNLACEVEGPISLLRGCRTVEVCCNGRLTTQHTWCFPRPVANQVAQLALGGPPRSVKLLPPLLENPNPLNSSLLSCEGQGEKKPVESFQPSTT